MATALGIALPHQWGQEQAFLVYATGSRPSQNYLAKSSLKIISQVALFCALLRMAVIRDNRMPDAHG